MLSSKQWRVINDFHAVVKRANALLQVIDKLHEQGKLSKAATLQLNDYCAELGRAIARIEGDEE